MFVIFSYQNVSGSQGEKKTIIDISHCKTRLSGDKIEMDLTIKDEENMILGVKYDTVDRASEVYNEIITAIKNGERIFDMPSI